MSAYVRLSQVACQQYVNGDIPSQWGKGANFDSLYGIETLESIANKLAQSIRSAGRRHVPNFGKWVTC